MLRSIVSLFSVGAVAGIVDGGITIDQRIVLPGSLDDSLTVDVTGMSSFTFEVIVQATVFGDPDANGIVNAFSVMQDDGTGAFDKGALTLQDVTGLDMPGLDPNGRTGLFPAFRSAFGDDNDNPGNGQFGSPFGSLQYTPLDLTQGGSGSGVGDNWASVYRATWTTTDLSERTVALRMVDLSDTSSAVGGYWSDGEFLQPIPQTSIPFTLTIVPSPGGAVVALGVGIVAVGRRRR